MKLNTIEEALEDIKKGKIVIVVDDEDRENEGDFVMSAELITPEAVNFMASVGRGLICTPLTKELAQKYDLPLQVHTNTANLGTAFTVTIDAKEKISTGISASDRAHTIRLLSQESTKPGDFVRPGHIFPLVAKDGGVLVRNGHTEASVDLCRLSGLTPVAVICEIINEDGTMARLPDLMELARIHQLKVISIEDLIKYRKQTENLISHVESIPFPCKYGDDFRLYIFRSELLGEEHMAIVKGELKDNPLVRVHSECFTGDVLGSSRCDCGAQLDLALKTISENGHGMVIYLKQEGRGIGLFNKIRAYQLQDQGFDTVDANVELGHPVDSRDYTMAAQILNYFNLKEVQLMTNNPQKLSELENFGIKNTRYALMIEPLSQNQKYLETKKTKLGHLLTNLK
ncbi:MAG TPA: bifunctional 3,4-dihydroxy-2-butanone-4-phosphate synthase/GTP cyclohydrolase II [Bacteriovoracaceae bacterium]|nr:bifunctional 3,4-dihydroxy-2-butanone-4-phosphate synthase/GTP cyclohydrolase II [Bacteriovoracaceae bacterium]